MRKIVNISDKPYEFTFDSGIYGPYEPGRVVELPNELAEHAYRRSVILDETGAVEGFRVKFVDQIPEAELKALMLYDCPLALAGKCKAESFRSVDDLRAHLDSHLQIPTGPPEQARSRAGR